MLLLLPTAPAIETTPYLTTVQEEELNISASGSFSLDYPYSKKESFIDLLYEPRTERFSKTVEDPTDKLYDLRREYFVEFQILKRYEEILDKIVHEYSQNKSLIDISKEEFFVLTDYLAQNLSSLNYEKITIEISPLNEIKFKTMLNDNTLLIITKPFENLKENYSRVLYSVFIDKKPVLNDYKNIEELVEGINQFIQ